MALVLDLAARNHLQPGDQRLGLAPAMGLHHPDDDVDAIAALGLGGLQHLKGLADAGGRAEKDFEPSLLVLRRLAQQRVGRGPSGAVAMGAVGLFVAHDIAPFSPRSLRRHF